MYNTYSYNLGNTAAVGASSTLSTIVSLIACVLLIVAFWKIFTKAGEKGWKSLIPIYNIYVFCRIIGINFWIYMLAIPAALFILLMVALGSAAASVATAGVGLSSLSAFTGFALVVLILILAYDLFISIYTAIKLGDAFGKSTGFKVGLVLLSGIFYLILAFDSSKYIGHKAVAKK